MPGDSKVFDLIELTVSVVSAYTSNNPVQAASLCELITDIHQQLETLNKPVQQIIEPARKSTPAQIKKSITPDAIISFEDGRPYKTLRRHLRVVGLTPETYREKWGLPASYPMVAESYSAKRAELARSIGLGQPARHSGNATAAADDTELQSPPKRRGRPRKAS